MPLSDYILYRLARNWPSPMRRLEDRYHAQVGTDEYQQRYTEDQFNRRVRDGLMIDVMGQDVLEIGCGHGGISCFLAMAAAKSVVGIDLNEGHLRYAEQFAARLAEGMGKDARLPVTFREMNAYAMEFPDASFDVVISENSFEHFSDPAAVLRESHRVLRPGGRLLVPNFSSIYSKYGLHLKNGLKMPWANLLFSERTIIRAMRRLAAENSKLYEWYPGLSDNPQWVRDLRPYKDLNDITYGKFKRMAAEIGFHVETFRPFGTRPGRVVARLPLLRDSILMDILSTGAAAVLRKKNAA